MKHQAKLISIALNCSLAALVLIQSSGCGALEHRIVFNPHSASKYWCQPHSDELAGLCFEDVRFASQDGTRLHGWFVQPADQPPQNVVLFAHGRSGNVSEFKDRLLEFVRRHDVAVLLFDYRGYGKSEGVPSEAGLYADGVAARDWLSQRTGFPPSEIVIMGRSLGVAVAVDVATRDGAKALIVENGFTSAADVLRHHSRNLLTGKRLHVCFDSENKIGKFTGPVFVSHGQRDKAIPYSQGVRLANLAKSATRIQFVKNPGGHLTPPTAEYELTLSEFFKSL